MTMREVLAKAAYQKEYEWHRRNAGSLLRVRHLFPSVVSEIRNHIQFARYYRFLLKRS